MQAPIGCPVVAPGSSVSSATAVQLADRAGDVVGVLVLGALAWHGTIEGNVAVGAIVLLLGGNTGIRFFGKRRGLPSLPGLGGLGVLGLLLVALLAARTAHATSTALRAVPPGAVPPAESHA